MNRAFLLFAAAVLPLCTVGTAPGPRTTMGAKITTYLRPYVRTNNFSGAVLVRRGGAVVFEQAFGFADRDRGVLNTPATQFHIASLSMQFTAAAIMRLVDLHKLNLDTPISQTAPGVPNASSITYRQLLEERSGLPDINDLPRYNRLLRHHETPAELVAAIHGLRPSFPPGGSYVEEEHSAYNVLALTIEKLTGMPFARAMHSLLFEPLQMRASGEDDDSIAQTKALALGYQPRGMYGLEPTPRIHWSTKSGNGSAYSTLDDEVRWIDALFSGSLFSVLSKRAMLDANPSVGYGWFKRYSSRFGEHIYYMNGRSPGFSSFVFYAPKEQLLVVLLSNFYSASPTYIGEDIAAIALGKSYKPLTTQNRVSSEKLEHSTGIFAFGKDFYQPNARLKLEVERGELRLVWRDGYLSPLLPIGIHHFIDRSYWQDVTIELDAGGRPAVLTYGRFRGTAIR